jgi:hypothetical protein
LEEAMQGRRPAASRPRREGPLFDTPHDDFSEEEIVEPATPRRELVPDRGAGAGPGSKDVRVWDLCRPHIVPTGIFLALMMLLVGGIYTLLGFYYSSRLAGPSSQEVFDARWDAHRRGVDIISQDEPGEGEKHHEAETTDTAPTGRRDQEAMEP